MKRQIHTILVCISLIIITAPPKIIYGAVSVPQIAPVAAIQAPKSVPKLEYVPFHYDPVGTHPNPFPVGQCTYGAASMKGNITWAGNAADWDEQAIARGITVSPEPIIGSVAQRDGGYGHVGVVINVREGEVLIAETNYDWHGSYREAWAPINDYQFIYL